MPTKDEVRSILPELELIKDEGEDLPGADPFAYLCEERVELPVKRFGMKHGTGH